jgi:hypothetical protein
MRGVIRHILEFAKGVVEALEKITHPADLARKYTKYT